MSGRIHVRIDRLTVDSGPGQGGRPHAGAIAAALAKAAPQLHAAGGDAVAKAVSAAIAMHSGGR